jgi:hypothetical protein
MIDSLIELLPLLAAVAVSDMVREPVEFALHLAESDFELADAVLDVLAVLPDLSREALDASLEPRHASRDGCDRAADRKQHARELKDDRHPVAHVVLLPVAMTTAGVHSPYPSAFSRRSRTLHCLVAVKDATVIVAAVAVPAAVTALVALSGLSS